MPELLLATKNAHKTAEVAAMLPGWEVADLTAHPEISAPEETGATFAENAEIKAVAASLRFDGLDDPEATRPPLLGEHTDDVLREKLGLNDEERGALRAIGAI